MAGKKTTRKKTVKKKTTGLKPVTKSTTSTRKKKTAANKTSTRPNYIVGIGASAGGLEAFTEFFTHMPSGSGMAFVLIPHLDPTHKSLIGELLSKYTSMPIQTAEDGMKVMSDNVYIIPPDKNLAILQGTLQLMEPVERRGLRHPIDFFLRTLAEDQQDKAIGIVLSGTGTEGAEGVRAIKAEDGMVIVQDVKSAKYDGMPQSAIDTGLADYIMPADKMPVQLLKFAKHPLLKAANKLIGPLSKQPDALHKVFILIRNQTGHDFSYYKLNTIIRRIERRMTMHQIADFDHYVKYLRENPSEVDMLFKELLIRVTGFFRDPQAFDVLRKKVLPNLLKNASYEIPLRVWVPACTTGEEAYSLAILFHELMTALKKDYKIQIFATDIDNEAIELARTGLFPETIADDLKKEQLKRYFKREGASFRINKEIREMVVFAIQNIIKEPPFSKLDLISCRNMLIYMGQELQKKLLPLFHYALNPTGFLFLGSSETIGGFADLFSVMDKKWKIFKAKSVPSPPLMAMDYSPVAAADVTRKKQIVEKERLGEVNLGELTLKILLENYAPSSVIVNEKGDILYFHGRTGRYLEPSPGKARLNVNEMAREGLKAELRTGIRKALTRKGEAFFDRLQVRMDGSIQFVNLHIRYISEPEHLKGLLMVVFEDVSALTSEKRTKKTSGKIIQTDKRYTDLEFELHSTKEQLQSTIEELEASNEELQSTNEELQSANEELQSTNEELETSKEELQSMNEELMTVNAESQNKIDELFILTNDMNNLLSGTDIATVFVDNDLHIKRFTPESAKLIKLIPTDVGRPLEDIATRLKYRDLVKDVQDVLKTLIPKEKEIQDENNVWYILKVIPYRTLDNVIDGAVVTLLNINDQKAMMEKLNDALDYTHGIIGTIREPLLILNAKLRVKSANHAFYSTFKAKKAETENRLIYDLGNRQWNIPRLRELLEKVLPKNSELRDFVVEHNFPGIGNKKMLLNARRIMQKGRGTETILLAIEDRTTG